MPYHLARINAHVLAHAPVRQSGGLNYRVTRGMNIWPDSNLRPVLELLFERIHPPCMWPERRPDPLDDADDQGAARTRHLDLTDMDKAVTYLTNNHRHMRYDKALEKGWPIATGMIEGALQVRHRRQIRDYRREMVPRRR